MSLRSSTAPLFWRRTKHVGPEGGTLTRLLDKRLKGKPQSPPDSPTHHPTMSLNLRSTANYRDEPLLERRPRRNGSGEPLYLVPMYDEDSNAGPSPRSDRFLGAGKLQQQQKGGFFFFLSFFPLIVGRAYGVRSSTRGICDMPRSSSIYLRLFSLFIRYSSPDPLRVRSTRWCFVGVLLGLLIYSVLRRRAGTEHP